MSDDAMTSQREDVLPGFAPHVKSSHSGVDSPKDRGTPQDLFDAINDHFGPIDFDACAEAHNHKLPIYISPEMDAFTVVPTVFGMVGFMNPPYGRGGVTGKWLDLARTWVREYGLTMICLVPAAVGTIWWEREVVNARETYEVNYLVGRVKFMKDRDTQMKSGADFDSAVVVYKPPLAWPHYRAVPQPRAARALL